MAITAIGFIGYAPLIIKEKVVSFRADDKSGVPKIVVDLGDDKVSFSFDSVADRNDCLAQFETEMTTTTVTIV